jgi:hypothetical protein
MPLDDDADDEVPRGAPLPPDDRLWRHPSEVSGEGPKQQIVLVTKGHSLGRTLAVAGLAGLIGAAATLGVVAGTDAFVRERKGDTAYSLREIPPPRSVGQSELAIADKVLPSVASRPPDNGVVNGTAVVFRNDGQLITMPTSTPARSSCTSATAPGSTRRSPAVRSTPTSRS